MQLLEQSLNRYIHLDSGTKKRLQKLQDKKVAIELDGFNLRMTLIFSDEKIYVHDACDEGVNTRIKGSPLSLLHVALTRENRQKFFAEDVLITGDAEVAQQVIEIFDALDIDWEEMAAHYIGDFPAHHLGKLVRKVKQLNQRVCETLWQNTNEYLHEEIDFFPTRELLQEFFTGVDEVRMEVDRLEARLKNL